MNKALISMALIGTAFALAACDSDADVASRNLRLF